MEFNIKPVSESLVNDLQHKIDFKTKPHGSLGKLEQIALRIGQIQNTLSPELNNPAILVFAADHGIVEEGVTPFPQEVTYQMVLNFLNGGAGINVFTKQHGINIKVVDSGVKATFNTHPGLINLKIADGTKNFLKQPAMTNDECIMSILKAAKLVNDMYSEGCNIIGFGEMGIGNTSSSAVIMSLLTNIPLNYCVGRGAGLNDENLNKKKEILAKALENNNTDGTPLSVLATFGGFEIAMMTGAMLKAAELGMILLIDGFIATVSLLVASKISDDILDYCIFTHQSDEQGHKLLLEYLNVEPVLNLNLRLGEGTGVAIAYPIIVSAISFLNEMASFDSAGVSNKEN